MDRALVNATPAVGVDFSVDTLGHFSLNLQRVPKVTTPKPRPMDVVLKYLTKDGTYRPICMEHTTTALDEVSELFDSIPLKSIYLFKGEVKDAVGFAVLNKDCIASCYGEPQIQLASCAILAPTCDFYIAAKAVREYRSNVSYDQKINCRKPPNRYFEVDAKARVFINSQRVQNGDDYLDRNSEAFNALAYRACAAMIDHAAADMLRVEKCDVIKFDGVFIIAQMKMTFNAVSKENLNLVYSVIEDHILKEAITFLDFELHFIEREFAIREYVAGKPVPFTSLLDYETRLNAGKVLGIIFGLILGMSIVVAMVYFLQKKGFSGFLRRRNPISVTADFQYNPIVNGFASE